MLWFKVKYYICVNLDFFLSIKNDNIKVEYLRDVLTLAQNKTY